MEADMTFLKNAWYIVGWRKELEAGALLHRKIANEPILVYTLENGSLAAIQDRCPHRFVPLHRGKQIGDTIQCGYHGLCFGADGKCTSAPVKSAIIPKAAKVKAYPVENRYGVIWVWLGAAEKADAVLIPNFEFLDDPKRGNVLGYMLTEASYLLTMDNLSDLTHVQFVHGEYQASEVFDDLICEMRQTGNTVTTQLTLPAGRVPYFFANGVPDPEELLDIVYEVRWDPPSTAKLTARAYAVGDRSKPVFDIQSAHIVSPETETTCHYFFGNSRDYSVGDPAADEKVREWQRIGFTEQDKPMLEAQQEMLGDLDVMDMQPVLLQTDIGAVRIRRVLTDLINKETAAGSERDLETRESAKLSA
jgi:phenylpropionate dioxygenase-like ring-hydroxylating dioxygenase large terminal subunit